VVDPRHGDVPAKSPHGTGDPFVVGGNQDPLDRTSLFHSPVNMLNQCFAPNFDDRLSGETSGLISGRDDGDGAIRIHIPHYREDFKLYHANRR
jgi:hypothetical protein